MILSVSRRTDIPAYYADWFFNRLKEGYYLKKNKKEYEKVVLSKSNIDCIVFWTKNPKPLMKYLNQIRAMGYEFYFQFTLTPYNNDMEYNIGNKREILQTFKELSKLIGSERVVWRYDPILINEKYNVEFHKKSFNQLAKALKGYTNECVISFVDEYSSIKKTAYYKSPEFKNIMDICFSFADTAKECGIKLKTCSEVIDFIDVDIEHGACIDKNKIEKLIKLPLESKKDNKQRPNCNCIESVDVGEYYTCLHNCAYCYAGGTDRVKCEYNNRLHNPTSPLMIGEPPKNANARKRLYKSLVKNEQITF